MKGWGRWAGNTVRSCWTNEGGVGSGVTLKCRILRRWCSMTKKHESSWKVNVGTGTKSQATIASRWLARKADQRLDGSSQGRIRRRNPGPLRAETSRPGRKDTQLVLRAT